MPTELKLEESNIAALEAEHNSAGATFKTDYSKRAIEDLAERAQKFAARLRRLLGIFN